MIPYERQQKLLEILKQKHSATVKELSGQLYISEASIRRDIEVLEGQGLVHRRYGGVILSGKDHGVVPLKLRESVNGVEKESIARRAAALVPDGATVFLDASSTVGRMMKYLSARKDVTVITNNARLLLHPPTGVTVYAVGGRVDGENAALVGPMAEQFLRSMCADMVFFSSQGIDEDGNITDASEAETALRRVMLSQSKQKFFLCDSGKIGVRRPFRVCGREDVDDILCDGKLPWEI